MRTTKRNPKSQPKRRSKKSTGEVAAPVNKDESVELRIEKLTNGYLITKSTYKNGEYKSEKTYSAKKPKLEASAEGK